MKAVDQNNDNVISWDEFIDMYGKFVGSEHSASQAVQTVIDGKAGKMTVTAAGGQKFYKDEEVSAMSFLVNNNLADDEDPEVTKRLPINPETEELFPNMADGLLFIKLLNCIDEKAIDLRTINKYKGTMNAVAVDLNIR